MTSPLVSVCPYCFTVTDAVTNVTDPSRPRPKAGDVNLCIECGGVACWTGDEKLTRPSPELEAEVRKSFVYAALQVMRQQRGKT